MSEDSVKLSRGRPKTLNRDHIIETAIQTYWEEGIDAVSINELCTIAKVSKPGLYREFGNEDGLKKAVLKSYEDKVLKLLTQMLKQKKPFKEVLKDLVLYVTSENDNKSPKGCLFVNIRESHMWRGEATQEQINRTWENLLDIYEDWVDRAKEAGEFTADMSSSFAATYIYSQVSFALSQVAHGIPYCDVRKILSMALSML